MNQGKSVEIKTYRKMPGISDDFYCELIQIIEKINKDEWEEFMLAKLI